jgi:ribonuclease Z
MHPPTKLHFLGTSGYHPNNHRQTACLMLPQSGIVLDAGTGLFRVGKLLSTPHLDIFLTHVHLDHVIGLTYLYDVLAGKNLERVTVHVAADKIEAIERHLYAWQLFPVQPNFLIVPLPEQRIVQHSSGVEILTIPLDHPGGCHAFRLNGLPGDRSLAYVTDTTADPEAEYVASLDGVHTLIHECYFPDGREERARLTGHSCLTPVAQVARKAKVGYLYLVHVDPLNEEPAPFQLDSVATIFDRIEVAVDQQVIDL